MSGRPARSISSRLIRHVADALEPLARELGVDASSPSCRTPPVIVTGDRDELIQVFENLIENACKYGQAGGRVVVAVRPATAERGPVSVGPRLRTRASPQEHLPRLTERFYRVDVDAEPAASRHRPRPRHRQAHPDPPSGPAGRREPGSARALCSLSFFHRASIGEAGDREEKTNTDQLVDLS